MTTTLTFRPITEKQIEFIRTLVAERELDEMAQDFLDLARAKVMAGTLSSKSASDVIAGLMECPKKSATPREEPEAGIYEEDGAIFRVYLGQKTGRMLVKQVLFSEGAVDYVSLGLATRRLPVNAVRLSLSEVGSLGVQSGHCLLCGRRLDDPESVDRGLGPVCAKRY